MPGIIAIFALFFLLPADAVAAEQLIAPDFTLSTPDGTQVTLASEVKEQTTVLFFWATWCPYCKALMPHLQSLRMKYGEDVEILAINIREDGDPVAFLNDAGYDFTLLLDGDEVADAYDVFATPGVLVINSDQTVHFNLYDLPRIEPPDNGAKPSHSRRAAYRAPYWAAEIRKAVDTVNVD